jgi:transposase InsO family protein
MDFVADQLADGRRFRALTVLDLFTRESLAIDVGQGLSGRDVVATLERLRFERGLPQRIYAITARSSSAPRWICGRIRTASSSPSVDAASRRTMPRSNRSTGASVKNA